MLVNNIIGKNAAHALKSKMTKNILEMSLHDSFLEVRNAINAFFIKNKDMGGIIYINKNSGRWSIAITLNSDDDAIRLVAEQPNIAPAVHGVNSGFRNLILSLAAASDSNMMTAA